MRGKVRIVFPVPLLQWTHDLYLTQRDGLNQASRQDEEWRSQRVLLSIWDLAGSAFNSRKWECDLAQRKRLRRCFRLLRRSWESHVASDGVASDLHFERARYIHDHVRLEPLVLAGFKVFLARQRAGRATARMKSKRHEDIALLALFLCESGVSRAKLHIALPRELQKEGIELSVSQLNRIFREFGV